MNNKIDAAITEENRRTTYHGMTAEQVEELAAMHSTLAAPGVWEQPYWIDILRDSVRRK